MIPSLGKGKAFTRSNLVASLHQPVGLEVRGIQMGLCPFWRRNNEKGVWS